MNQQFERFLSSTRSQTLEKSTVKYSTSTCAWFVASERECDFQKVCSRAKWWPAKNTTLFRECRTSPVRAITRQMYRFNYLHNTSCAWTFLQRASFCCIALEKKWTTYKKFQTYWVKTNARHREKKRKAGKFFWTKFSLQCRPSAVFGMPRPHAWNIRKLAHRSQRVHRTGKSNVSAQQQATQCLKNPLQVCRHNKTAKLMEAGNSTGCYCPTAVMQNWHTCAFVEILEIKRKNLALANLLLCCTHLNCLSVSHFHCKVPNKLWPCLCAHVRMGHFSCFEKGTTSNRNFLRMSTTKKVPVHLWFSAVFRSQEPSSNWIQVSEFEENARHTGRGRFGWKPCLQSCGHCKICNGTVQRLLCRGGAPNVTGCHLHTNVHTIGRLARQRLKPRKLSARQTPVLRLHRSHLRGHWNRCFGGLVTSKRIRSFLSSAFFQMRQLSLARVRANLSLQLKHIQTNVKIRTDVRQRLFLQTNTHRLRTI